MMVAAIVFLGESRPANKSCGQIRRPKSQRAIEQPALLEILDQTVASLVDIFALDRQAAGDIECVSQLL